MHYSLFEHPKTSSNHLAAIEGNGKLSASGIEAIRWNRATLFLKMTN
jgi:hypothetical protein